MNRRSRRAACALGVLCLLAAASATPAQAYTWVYTDIINFNLTETASSAGGGTQFHISSTGDGNVRYRWVDSPSKDTIISGNSCGDLSSFGSHYYNSGVTVYRQLFSGESGRCFLLRGRTASGQGSMTNYDGRLER